MTWAGLSAGEAHDDRGEVFLAEAVQKVNLAASALQASWLFAEIRAPGPAVRGRLALLIETAIEEALQQRGAAPPGVGASSDLDASLSDQLYRARQVGARGLALAFGSLEGIANLAGALDAEDSAVLRWWFRAAEERPVRIALDVSDRFLGVYSAPTTLGALLEGKPYAAAREEAADTDLRPPCPSPELVASVQAMDLSAPAPAVAEWDPTPSHAPTGLLADCETDAEDTPNDRELSVHEMETAIPAEVEARLPEAGLELAARVEVEDAPAESDVREAPVSAEPVSAEPLSAAPEPHPEPAPVPAPSPDAPLHNTPDVHRWIRELTLARGPKPLATIERMFVSAYVPLSDAVLRREADERAQEALAQWATSFERSYRDAFEALKLRGKRPLMVLDLPDAALRIGRLHGARNVQLLLVDGMRFDLGLKIQEQLRPLLGQRAALTERLLMWSALPATTAVQLELIGRGPEGLRDPSSASPDSEYPVARGRSAATVRRVRAGAREIMKLDTVEARLGEPGGPWLARLDEIALETAEALAQHFLRLAPRTLVMVFGDHGFCIDAAAHESGAARQGGASPEEVLVPAFAWLVGDVH
jgi:hypothetical protein